jgi:hypothetical protein
MNSTAVMTLQTVWDCRWSQPGHRLTGVADSLQPESLWVCVRGGNRRAVTEAECETCPHWQCQEPAAAVAIPAPVRLTVAATPSRLSAIAAHMPEPSLRLEAALRTMLVLAAIVFAYTGFALLTRPIALLVAWPCWATAMAMFAYGTWGRFPRDAESMSNDE